MSRVKKVLTKEESHGNINLALRGADKFARCASGGIGRLAGFRCQCSQGRAGSTPASGTTSEQSPLCSDVFLCLWQKRRHPPAPLFLLPNCDPLRWARSWWAALQAAFSPLRNIDFNRPSQKEKKGLPIVLSFELRPP